MNEPTTTTKSEFVFRRLGDSFDQFTGDVLFTFFSSWWILALLAFVVFVRIIYRFANPSGRAAHARDATVWGVVWGTALSLLAYGVLHEASVAILSYAGKLDVPLWRRNVALGAGLVGSAVLFTVLILAAIRAIRYVGSYMSSTSRAPGAGDPISLGLAWMTGLLCGLLTVWCLVVFYVLEAAPKAEASEPVSSLSSGNTFKWYTFTVGIFTLGSLFVALMYIRDTRSVRWYWAVPLALLRMTVYAILCGVFLLPAMQTWEDTNKQSRVVILLDITPSVTSTTDEIGTGPGRKPKTRMDLIIEFLTDEKIAFIKNLLDKNPVAVYAFGTRLDESPQMINPGDAPWSKADWHAFASYDFKPFVLRDLSAEGKEQLKKLPEWDGEKPGTADWAQSWSARRNDSELAKHLGLDPADMEKLQKNLERLDKRIDVARTIALGTNVADSVTAAVSREAPNMVQGIIVFSDGRSNLGSDSGYLELRDRASREKIPIFTIAVGEDRQAAAITITDVQAPDSAPIDEAWKIIVEADGVNMANKEVEVFLDLFMPGHDMKTAAPDHTFTEKLVFAPGDPPHGQTEFVIDPAKLPEKLTVESKDAAIKKRVFPEGKWSARARIAKDAQEAFPDPEHIRDRPDINVVRQKLRVLLVAGAPGREFTFIRTLLVREVQDQRATLTTFVQNEAGTTGHLTPEKDEIVIRRFPNRLDLTNKQINPDEKPYNLNEYDVLIAFDPDWSELSQQQADDLGRWVREGGGGLIYIGGPINTFQLARVEENNGRLLPLLNILPVIPADIVAQRIKPIPKTPRRLKLYPERIIGSELLKLEDKIPNDPIAGWELFFTDREKYTPDPDLKKELFPHRGFFSAYPVKEVKPGSAVLAEFMDLGDNNEASPQPWIVTNNPSAAYRSVFLASAELYRLRTYDPSDGTGREYFERFWFKLIKYMAAKRNFKAPRGRILVSKEGITGTPMRVQARILNENAKPYDRDISPKFKVVQETPSGDKREFGPFDLIAKKSPGAVFDGYYAGQVVLDPKQFPPGDSIYRVVVDVPDSPGETLSGEFRVRKSDPEKDNTRPDYPAMLRMASEFDKDFQAKIPDKVKGELGKSLPKEGGVPRLAFKLADKEQVALIPDCMITIKTQNQNRGPVRDLWDLPVEYDLSRTRVLVALMVVLGSALVLMLLRGLWAVVAHVLPNWLRIVLIVLWLLNMAVGLLVMGVMLLFIPELGLYWTVAFGLALIAILCFRVPWWMGLSILGALAVASVVTSLSLPYFDYEGMTLPISFGLPVVVGLLCCEWTARKFLRLA